MTIKQTSLKWKMMMNIWHDLAEYFCVRTLCVVDKFGCPELWWSRSLAVQKLLSVALIYTWFSRIFKKVKRRFHIIDEQKSLLSVCFFIKKDETSSFFRKREVSGIRRSPPPMVSSLILFWRRQLKKTPFGRACFPICEVFYN